MKTINHVCYWDGDIGGYDFFYDSKWNLLSWWGQGDAEYRPEYMNGLFKALGFKVVSIDTEKNRRALRLVKVLLKKHSIL